MLSETYKTTARQRAERQGVIMTYIYAYKRVGETEWHIAETTTNMNECEFLRWLFDPANGHSKFDKIRILEIIK
jgi:hypothetical protein